MLMKMVFNKKISIGNSIITESSPTFIIAEAGVNHNGNISLAKQLIDIAVEARVDAVKFQNFKTESLILKNIPKAQYQKRSTPVHESQEEMLRGLELNLRQTKELMDYCTACGITFLTTPYDERTLDELDELSLPAYKIASTDATNLSFIEKVAAKGKPVFISSGMCYLSEIEMALSIINATNPNCALLQCTGNYPATDSEVNLNVIHLFKNRFEILVGFSDHTKGVGAAPHAVAAGAKIIEKHFTIDKSMPGPDHKASLCPKELKKFVSEIRKVERWLGNGFKIPTASEQETRKSLQKCLVASRRIEKGDIFSNENLIPLRTGGRGLSPIYFFDLAGKPSPKVYHAHEPIVI